MNGVQVLEPNVSRIGSEHGPRALGPLTRRHVIPLLSGAIVLVEGYSRRWLSDDGVIAVTVAQRIASGNGPVINPGERVEASTSVLWPWLLAAFSWLPVELTRVAIVLGIVLSAAGVVFAIQASFDLQQCMSGYVVPAGVLVVLAVPAFSDFFSSGLDTGLTFFWLGWSWLLLVRLDRGDERWLCAIVLGMGPLVRPDLGIAMVVFAAAALIHARPGAVKGLGWVAVVLLPSVVYEIFRAGFFGVLVPNPAIAKEASSSNWGQGAWYLADLIISYHLWIPILSMTAALWLIARRQRSKVIVIAPPIAACMMALYVVRVGGDFMHARLLLPALFCFLLPAFVTTHRRPASMVIPTIMGTWAVACVAILGPSYSGTETFRSIVDERSQTLALLQLDHVNTVDDFKPTNSELLAAAGRVNGGPYQLAYVPYDGWRDQAFIFLPRPGGSSSSVLAAHALGMTSQVAAQRRVLAHDLLGLGDPVTAHYRLEDGRGRPGHEKWLPDAWAIARYADPTAALPPGVSPTDVGAARRALECGSLAELRAAYTAELTPGRFWRNLVGAVDRTSFRFSPSPQKAVVELC